MYGEKWVISRGSVIFAVTIAVALVGLTGCQTMAGWFGIASEQHVDDRIVEMQAQIDERMVEKQAQIDERMVGMQAQIDKYVVAADQLEGLIESLGEMAQTTEELESLASVLEERLVDLPDETIRQLVGVLQGYLDSK